jgi:hypothetical protein
MRGDGARPLASMDAALGCVSDQLLVRGVCTVEWLPAGSCSLSTSMDVFACRCVEDFLQVGGRRVLPSGTPATTPVPPLLHWGWLRIILDCVGFPALPLPL